MMDEKAAVAWLLNELNVPRETMAKLEGFAALLHAENQRQNLVSKASFEHIWARHIVDSAQLLRFAPEGDWLDLGTGAGFPGLIIAVLRRSNIVLVEERRRRAEFLNHAAATLGIDGHTQIICAPLERVPTATFSAISARAFAPLPQILTLAERFAGPATRWILPKGRNAKTELEAARASWQGDFRIEPSLTDPDAGIIVAEHVGRRRKGNEAQ